MAFLNSDQTPRKGGRIWISETLVVLGILAFGYFVIATDGHDRTSGNILAGITQPSHSAR